MLSPCARESSRSVRLIQRIFVLAAIFSTLSFRASASTDQPSNPDSSLNPSPQIVATEVDEAAVVWTDSAISDRDPIDESGDKHASFDTFTLQLKNYDGPTQIDWVGPLDQTANELIPTVNFPPTALCRSATVCADHYSCDADVSVDAGSFDPDGDLLTQEQFPFGPYEIGIHTVTLSVTDPNGATSQCTTTVIVEDCTPPDLLCPDAMAVQCQLNGISVVLPGTPHGKDCSDFVIASVGELLLPLGQSIVVHSATDAFGHTTTCDQVIVVFDVDTDGDGLVDCIDLCPMVTAYGPFGCGGLALVPYDGDGDGVIDDIDLCPSTPAGDVVDETGCTITLNSDADADGVEDSVDACPDTPASVMVDATGCAIPAPIPIDSDNDGVPDDQDECPESPSDIEVDANGCPLEPPPPQPIPDSDGDGVNDEVDLCPDTIGMEVDDVGCYLEGDDNILPPDGRNPCGLCTLLALGVCTCTLMSIRLSRSGMAELQVRRTTR